MNNKKEFPSGIQAFLLFVALILCEVLVGAVLQDMQGMLSLDIQERNALVTLLGNGLIFTFLMHFKGLTYPDLFHPSAGSAGATFFVLTVPILMLVPASILIIMQLMEVLVKIAPLSAWEEAAFRNMSSGSLAAVIATCVLAPVLEEMLFRGIILRSFLNQYPRWQAILGSSLLFGFAHLNIYQFFVALLIGVMLGWLYERTRSLIPCIAFHAFYNMGISVFEALYVDNLTAKVQPVSFFGWVISLLLAAGGMLALMRMLRKPRLA
ncbi:MAG: type II CAAX endopeptidase family protein [Pseudomonadota bacterium]